jgi:hypothetical protein
VIRVLKVKQFHPGLVPPIGVSQITNKPAVFREKIRTEQTQRWRQTFGMGIKTSLQSPFLKLRIRASKPLAEEGLERPYTHVVLDN